MAGCPSSEQMEQLRSLNICDHDLRCKTNVPQDHTCTSPYTRLNLGREAPNSYHLWQSPGILTKAGGRRSRRGGVNQI